MLPSTSSDPKSTSFCILMFAAYSLPVTVIPLVISTSSCILTVPVPLARNSKLTSVAVVLIVLPLILTLSICAGIPALLVFKLDTVRFTVSKSFATDITPIVVTPLTVNPFSIVTLSLKLTTPVPFALSSKLAFESFVLITLPLKDMPSNILLPTPVIPVAVILFAVSVLVTVVDCNEVSLVVVKLLLTIKFSLIFTLPVPVPLNVRSLLLLVVEILFPLNIMSSNIICLF